MRRFLAVIGFTLFTMPQLVGASQHSCASIGQVISSQGYVKVQRKGSLQWDSIRRQSEICEGDTVKTGFRSRAAINLANETVLRIKQSTSTNLTNFTANSEAKSLLRLISGVIHFFSRKPREYEVATTTATIGIRGTEFVVSVNGEQTDLTVFEGEVEAANDVAPVVLSGGEMVRIVNGQTLRVDTPVKPRNQVHWGLYYPPLLSLNSFSSTVLHKAGQCAQRGDYECAFDELEQVASGDQDGDYLSLLASLLLAVGDIENAQNTLSQAQAISPANPNIPALKAIIAVTQNQLEDAMDNATRAVRLEENSLPAAIALSYAQQAGLDLNAAHATLQTAVNQHPDSALAWARLAELSLALGKNEDSRHAAQQAVTLDANLSRTHMVLGYAALSQIDPQAAKGSFESALNLDSADPMAHLGLGLSLIRMGDLVEGRKEIEAAVALDSNNAILRPYLGRAYFEEKRSPLDAEQYAIAKQLDPNDPTAYLFDALRKHSENRPVEAMQDLQASIERNDNRAVYRGRNALDQDRAARGASLARIYDSLGFSHQGITEASNSLNIDPGNDSAHRFLSDSYRPLRRREISRVSELLQAQMLQDINLNPVQPSVSSTNLNIGSGAGAVGLNEFTRLFESNNLQTSISYLGGSNETTAAEAVVSGIYNSLSFSLGAFDYESDGWRENNDQDQQLGNLFVQWAATPKLNFQAEISSRESSEGDLAFNFDPDSLDATLNHDREFDSQRIGMRYSPTSNSDILVSHIESKREENKLAKLGLPAFTAFFPSPPFPPGFPDPGSIDTVLYDSDIGLSDDSSQSEVQYLWNDKKFNLVIGLASAEIDTTQTTVLVAPAEAVSLIIPELDESTSSKLEHDRIYIYSTLFPGQDIDLTIGLSSDDYVDSKLTRAISSTSPKLGLKWRVNPQQTLRIAAFEVTKPALANNRTLEPTQVAGFNQLFDDVNATNSQLVGIGYDYQLSPTLQIGFEASSREMEIPFLFTDINNANALSTEFEDQEEKVARVHLNWLATNAIAVTAAYISDTFKSGPDSDINTPVEVETKSLPIGFRYFSQSRWYAGITATMVEQEIERNSLSALAAGNEDFNLIDLHFGYRLPKRMGSISVEVRNATDEEFNYQDDSYREFRDEPSIGPYFPETTAYIQANLVF